MVGMIGMVWYCMQEEQEEAASLEGMVCYGRYGMVGMVWYCMQEEAGGGGGEGEGVLGKQEPHSGCGE